MDSAAEPEEREEIFRNAWKSKLQQVVSEKTRDPFLQEARYTLPWGFAEIESYKKINGFYKRDLEENDSNEIEYTSDIQLFKFFATRKVYKYSWLGINSIKKDYPMILYVKPGGMGIRQAFKGTVKESTFVRFKDNFFYKWDNRTKLITISYALGTLETSKLLDSCEKLFDESKNFYIVYTEQGKKILKNVV